MKGKVKTRWGRLTDDDLTAIEGNVDLVAGRIQERYGIAKDAAQREWNEFCRQCSDLQQGSKQCDNPN